MFSQKITVFVEERQSAQFLIHNRTMAVYYLDADHNNCPLEALRFFIIFHQYIIALFIVITLVMKFRLKYFGLKYK